MTVCRDCSSPTRGRYTKLCQPCKDRALARARAAKNKATGIITGACHLCGDPASGPRSYYCAGCRKVIRRKQFVAYRVRKQRARKEKVAELLALVHRRIDRMLWDGKLDGEAIRAMGRALAQVHIDGEDRWLTNQRRQDEMREAA